MKTIAYFAPVAILVAACSAPSSEPAPLSTNSFITSVAPTTPANPSLCTPFYTAEVEPNNFPSKATALPDFSACGEVAPGDVDYFEIEIPSDMTDYAFSKNLSVANGVSLKVLVNDDPVPHAIDSFNDWKDFPILQPGDRLVVVARGSASTPVAYRFQFQFLAAM